MRSRLSAGLVEGPNGADSSAERRRPRVYRIGLDDEKRLGPRSSFIPLKGEGFNIRLDAMPLNFDGRLVAALQ